MLYSALEFSAGSHTFLLDVLRARATILHHAKSRDKQGAPSQLDL